MNKPQKKQMSKGKTLEAAKVESKKAAKNVKDVIRQTGPSVKASGQRIPDAGQ